MLGELKWRESCSGFRSRRAGLWPASDLPGHCLNSGPACKDRSAGTLDKKGSVSWNSGGPGGLASPPGSKKSWLTRWSKQHYKSWRKTRAEFLCANWWWHQFVAWDYKWKWKVKVKVKAAQSCLTLCDPMDCIVHGILQARTLEWVAFPFSRGFSQPRDRTQDSSIAGGFFTSWATREAQEHWSG